MAFKFTAKRWHKLTAIVLGVLVGVVLILSLLVNSYWSPILSSKVKDVVFKSSDGLYTVNFSSAELHVLRGTIDIYNITLQPDTAVFNLKKKQNLGPNNLVVLHVKRLTLSHMHPFKLYFQHRLEIGEVIMDEPVLNISYQLNHKKDTVLAHHQTAWQKISKSLSSIHIGDILLGNVKLKYEDYTGNKIAVSEFKEMNLSAHDLLIDSTTQTDKSRLLYCKDIVLELNNYSAQSPSGLYTYKFDHLKLSTLHSRLNIEGLTLKPIKAEEFFKKSDQDKFSIRLDSLQVDHFDFLNYHKYRTITAANTILTNGSLEVSGNPKHTDRATDRVVTYPNVGLFGINTDLRLDTVNLHHIDVFYNEYNQRSKQTGTVSFYNTSGSFLNITTRPEVLQKNNICKVNLTSRFMKQGTLKVAFAFNLTDENKSFSYKGSLGPMNLRAINPATMPLTMIKIQSGTLKQMDFDISAGRSASHGKITMLYNDVKVNILRIDTVFEGLQARPIESLYANLFILKHNNPDVPGGTPRSFFVNETRTSQTPFFKFVWQNLLAGIKPSIGLDKQKLDQTIALINQMAADKKDRKVKKQLRQERRAERRLKKAEKKTQKGG